MGPQEQVWKPMTGFTKFGPISPTLINTPELANQGLDRYTWNLQAGVLRQVGANSKTQPSRTESSDPLTHAVVPSLKNLLLPKEKSLNLLISLSWVEVGICLDTRFGRSQLLTFVLYLRTSLGFRHWSWAKPDGTDQVYQGGEVCRCRRNLTSDHTAWFLNAFFCFFFREDLACRLPN